MLQNWLHFTPIECMALEKALYQTTGLRNVSDASVGQLAHLATEYPYFATAQLLLAAKLKQEGKTGAFQQQLQKAALFSTNPFWLNYQLTNDAAETIDVLATTASSSTNFVEKPFIHPILSSEMPSGITAGALEASEIDTKPLFNEDIALQPVEELPTIVETAKPAIAATNQYSPFSDLVDVPTLPTIKEESVTPISTEPSEPSNNLNTLSNIQWDPYVDVPGVVSFGNNLSQVPIETTTASFASTAEVALPQVAPIVTPSSTIEIPTLEAVKQLLGNNNGPALPQQPPITQSGVISNEVITPVQTSAAQAATHLVETSTTANFPKPDFTAFNAVTLSEEAFEVENEINNTEAITDTAVAETPNVDTANNIASLLGNQAANFKKPVGVDEKLEFEKEPYYTIDYFASQGIKIDLTKQPQDKLTTQLRRFTDWLKHMKKIDPNPVDLGTDPELEKAIADIAQTSLSAREIVTETMADIFVKQGKVDKAIQLFIKLSFLDPEKSAYFATKIQQLKGI